MSLASLARQSSAPRSHSHTSSKAKGQPIQLHHGPFRGTFVLSRLLILLSLFGGATRLFAQAAPTASRPGDLIIGAGYTTAQSDYGGRYTGFAIYGDFDLTRHLGVELNFHKVDRGNSTPLYEKTYEIGPRYFRTYGPFVPYVKFMIGRGVFNYPANPPPAPQDQARANLAYNMYAGGFGTDIKIRHYLYVRADYELQKWPSFPANGLSPQLFTVGAAYHFR